MSKARERLVNHRHAVTVWDDKEIAKNQKYTIEACEAYDIAMKAIEAIENSVPRLGHVGCESCTRVERDLKAFLEGRDE